MPPLLPLLEEEEEAFGALDEVGAEVDDDDVARSSFNVASSSSSPAAEDEVMASAVGKSGT